MSLLNKASLIQIPSGYKDGTLYSVKPTNGDGDFTFSRGSNLAATRVNSEGLIEKGRENLLLQSNTFNTTWAFGGAISVSSGQSGYDGSSDAWLLEKTATIFANISQSVSHSGVHTFSVYAKQGTNTSMILRSLGGTDAYSYFDLSAGTITGSTSNIIDSQIEAAGNGFYRCSITYNASSNTSIVMYPEVPFTGTSAGNILIQDAQLEQGLVATDYIETTTTTEQAGILEDMPRLDYSGGATCGSLLLEPQRSNLVTQSEYGGDYLYINTSYVQNTQVSPEGVINSTTIESDTTNSTHYFGSNFHFFTSGTTYTSSIFIKKGTGRYFQLTYGSGSFGLNQYANYDLQDGVVAYEATSATASIEDFGNGWYRCVLTATATSNFSDRFYAVFITSGTASRVQSHSSSLNYYFYGFQIEEGSYPTSYIPTYGSGASVTRGADVCVKTGISDLIGQTEGTLFMEAKSFADVYANTTYTAITNSTGSNRIVIGIASASNELRIVGVFSGVSNGGDNYAIADTTTYFKVAVKYYNSTLDVFINGVKQTSQTFGGFSNSVDTVRFDDGLGALKFEGDVKQRLIFPTALTDAECEQLTTL